MTANKIVYMEPVPAGVRDIISERLPGGFEIEFRASTTPAEVAVVDADFILVATTKVTPALLDSGMGIRLIQHQGVGYDNIDLDAAKARKVPVAICPAGTSIGVAEHVVLLILAIYRRLLEAEQSMRDGQWLQWELRSGSFELAGKTVGLVGMGRIGRQLAKRLQGFDTETIYFDPVRSPEDVERSFSISHVGFNELLARADIVSLHLPLLPETRNLIDANAIARMKNTAILVNTARGGLVDQAALIDALKEGRIGGAGLDVFTPEPLPEDSPLRSMPNAVLTPHIAAGTEDALRTKMDACFANIVAVAEGREPDNRIV